MPRLGWCLAIAACVWCYIEYGACVVAVAPLRRAAVHTITKECK
jgi:hypothetical protein